MTALFDGEFRVLPFTVFKDDDIIGTRSFQRGGQLRLVLNRQIAGHDMTNEQAREQNCPEHALGKERIRHLRNRCGRDG